MLKRINFKNIYYSFWLGIIISIVVQIRFESFIISNINLFYMLICGFIGIVIGFITELATAMLPARIAKTGLFFFINNLIAILTTISILSILNRVTSVQISNTEFRTVIFIALIIIILANITEFILYKKTNKKLRRFQDNL